MNVYVAASFAYEDKEKTNQRKLQIENVVNRIKSIVGDSFNFYLPHQYKVDNAWDISLEEWSRKVYEHDIFMLKQAQIILFISFGKENNSGAVWELGYVSGMNTIVRNLMEDVCEPVLTKLICIKMTDQPESLMITNSVDVILKENEIESYDWFTLKDYKTDLEKVS